MLLRGGLDSGRVERRPPSRNPLFQQTEWALANAQFSGKVPSSSEQLLLPRGARRSASARILADWDQGVRGGPGGEFVALFRPRLLVRALYFSFLSVLALGGPAMIVEFLLC